MKRLLCTGLKGRCNMHHPAISDAIDDTDTPDDEGPFCPDCEAAVVKASSSEWECSNPDCEWEYFIEYTIYDLEH